MNLGPSVSWADTTARVTQIWKCRSHSPYRPKMCIHSPSTEKTFGKKNIIVGKRSVGIVLTGAHVSRLFQAGLFFHVYLATTRSLVVTTLARSSWLPTTTRTTWSRVMVIQQRGARLTGRLRSWNCKRNYLFRWAWQVIRMMARLTDQITVSCPDCP